MATKERTIGEAYRESLKLERDGNLAKRFDHLLKHHEATLGITYPQKPQLKITMDGHGEFKDGKIEVQYWDKPVIDHEAGHAFLIGLCAKLGMKPLVSDENPKADLLRWDQVRGLLISEGVATYFEKKLNKGRDDFHDEEYPKTIEDMTVNDFNVLLRMHYEGGYHLVKPILDRLGVEEGCRTILLDRPKKEEMVRLPEYRERILKKKR